MYIDRLHGDAIVGGPRCENKGEDCYYHRCNRGKDVIVESTVDGISLTQLFKSVTPDQQIELRSITSTADDGKYHAKLKVYYDPAKLVFNDDYSPTSCMIRQPCLHQSTGPRSYMM